MNPPDGTDVWFCGTRWICKPLPARRASDCFDEQLAAFWSGARKFATPLNSQLRFPLYNTLNLHIPYAEKALHSLTAERRWCMDVSNLRARQCYINNNCPFILTSSAKMFYYKIHPLFSSYFSHDRNEKKKKKKLTILLSREELIARRDTRHNVTSDHYRLVLLFRAAYAIESSTTTLN